MTDLIYSLFLIAVLFLVGQYALMSIVATTWWAKRKYHNKKKRDRNKWRGGMRRRLEEHGGKNNEQYTYITTRADVICRLYNHRRCDSNMVGG